MKRAGITVLCVLCWLPLGTLSGCSRSDTPEPAAKTTLSIAQSEDLSQRALAILNEKCVVCHTSERFDAVEFTQEQWNAVIERMVTKGAKLSGEDLDVLRHWRPAP